MAYVQPVEDFSGQSTNGANGPTRERNFWVYASSDENVKAILWGHYGIRRGAPFRDVHGMIPDSYLICVDIKAVPVTPVVVDGFGLYKVSVEYAYGSVAVQTAKPQTPDLSPKYKIEPNEESVPADIDIHGRPIVNAADEPIDPPLTKFKDRETLVVTWHKWARDYITVYASKRQYRKKVNATEIFGAPPKCLLCRDIRVDELNVPDQAGYYFMFRLTARLEFREPITLEGVTYPGWVSVYPNLGHRVKTDDPDKPYKQIRESNTDMSTMVHVQPFMLDPAGFEALGHNPTPNYRSVDLYEEIEMSDLIS